MTYGEESPVGQLRAKEELVIKVVMVITVLLVAVTSHAAVKIVGQGSGKNFDPAGIPASLRPNLEIMQRKCTRCHSMERIVDAVTTGVAPISGQPFDVNAVKAYGLKMMRKSSTHMTKQEIVAAIELMNHLVAQAAL